MLVKNLWCFEDGLLHGVCFSQDFERELPGTWEHWGEIGGVGWESANLLKLGVFRLLKFENY